MKRGKSESLTGGTGDVNPQNMKIVLEQMATDAFAQNFTPLPIPRYPQQNGKQIVMEVLGVTFTPTQWTIATSATNKYFAQLSTNPNIPASIRAAVQDPRGIAHMFYQIITGATPNTFYKEGEYYIDLTDNAGHGLLIATDNIYGYITTEQTTGANFEVVVNIEYRFKQVSLAEYIGIVQSQQ